ncbi:MAG: hypothetical protein KAR39_05380 [Thermoplasmata archaeon]|nr:hypothetical protein [Thermoplasmata archaeon]
MNEEQKRNFKNMWMDVKCKELLTDTDRCWVCGRSSEELADMNIELERNEHLREFDYPFKTCDACNTFAELQGSEYAFETRDKIEKLKSLVESISTSVLSFLEKNDQED